MRITQAASMRLYCEIVIEPTKFSQRVHMYDNLRNKDWRSSALIEQTVKDQGLQGG